MFDGHCYPAGFKFERKIMKIMITIAWEHLVLELASSGLVRLRRFVACGVVLLSPSPSTVNCQLSNYGQRILRLPVSPPHLGPSHPNPCLDLPSPSLPLPLPLPLPLNPSQLRSLLYLSAQLNELQMYSSQPSPRPSGFTPKPLILVQRARASSLSSQVENLTRAVEQKVLLVKRSLPSLPPSPRSESPITYLRNGRPLTGHTSIESYAIVSIFSLSLLDFIIH